jgi:hypothetical protein
MFVEWADRIGHALPPDRIVVRMAHLPAGQAGAGGDKRSISVNEHPVRS